MDNFSGLIALVYIVISIIILVKFFQIANNLKDLNKKVFVIMDILIDLKKTKVK